jgi:hypothetical protein
MLLQSFSRLSGTSGALIALTTAALVACSDGAGPKTQMVSISMATKSAAPAASIAASVTAVPITGGGHTLDLTAMQLTIGDLRLEHAGNEAEDDHGGIGEHDEAFGAGSQTIALPVSGGVVTLAAKALPAGTFSEVEADLQFLHLVGTYDATPFDVSVELSHDMKLVLDPPLTTTGGADQNITVTIDLSSCFANAGTPVDPRTLLPGGNPARSTFRECIASHLRAFEDRDRDGIETGDDHGGLR